MFKEELERIQSLQELCSQEFGRGQTNHYDHITGNLAFVVQSYDPSHFSKENEAKEKFGRKYIDDYHSPTEVITALRNYLDIIEEFEDFRKAEILYTCGFFPYVKKDSVSYASMAYKRVREPDPLRRLELRLEE